MGSRAISMKNVRAFKVVTSCPLWATVEKVESSRHDLNTKEK